MPEVEKYFNSIRTLQARFVQSNPNGCVVQGTLYLRRPGRMRFEYDRALAAQDRGRRLPGDDVGSAPTAISASGRSAGRRPRSWSRSRCQLSGDLTVEKSSSANGLLQLTMVQTRKPQEGKIIVRVSENPMQLRGWSIIDNRGNRST